MCLFPPECAIEPVATAWKNETSRRCRVDNHWEIEPKPVPKLGVDETWTWTGTLVRETNKEWPPTRSVTRTRAYGMNNRYVARTRCSDVAIIK